MFLRRCPLCDPTEISLARLAWTNLPKTLEAVDSSGVTVGKLDLYCVVSYGGRSLGLRSRLVDRQQVTAAPFCLLVDHLLALVVAHRTGAMVAQVGKIVEACVAIRPGDFDALARRHMNLHADGFLPRILWYRHRGAILTASVATVAKRWRLARRFRKADERLGASFLSAKDSIGPEGSDSRVDTSSDGRETCRFADRVRG